MCLLLLLHVAIRKISSPPQACLGRYNRTEALLNWPPATEGPKAAAIKWFGGLKAGRIFLARQTTLEDSDVVPVVEIPLAGCSVRLVTEGLRGKTRWWRKTPLEISHPTRALLARQRTFFLFCDGSAAKEQWLTAVSWACSGGGAPQAVQDLYATFCSALRNNRRLSFPQVMDMTAEESLTWAALGACRPHTPAGTALIVSLAQARCCSTAASQPRVQPVVFHV